MVFVVVIVTVDFVFCLVLVILSVIELIVFTVIIDGATANLKCCVIFSTLKKRRAHILEHNTIKWLLGASTQSPNSHEFPNYSTIC